MDDDQDTYVSQLKQVFISCDATGSGCLNEAELQHLCKKLHLTDQMDILIYELQKNKTSEVTFEDFKNSFVALLSRCASNDDDEEEEDEVACENEIDENEKETELSINDDTTDREISPKFTLGRKQYGRRSRPASVIEDDEEGETIPGDQNSIDDETLASSLSYVVNQKVDSGPGKRPMMSDSFPQSPPSKSGRMTTGHNRSIHHRKNSITDSEGSFENNAVEYLQETWKRLGIGSDGFLTVEELAMVCEHIGMDMTEEVISQLFEKLDCDQDGRISFDEFVQGLFQHGDTQNHGPTSLEAKVSSSLYKESSRDEQLSTASISGIFSCLDVNNTGYAEGSSIVELWESLDMPFSPRMLEELGYSLRRKVNLGDLSSALEEEIISCINTPLGQLALLTYQNELNYLRQSNEQIRIERNKLRENIEDANLRAVLLAQEVDDNHAKLENALHDKIAFAERKYHEQVRELMDDFQQERDSLAHQTTKLKQQLQSEMQSIREEESQLKNRLSILEQENSRLESELQNTVNRCTEAEKHRDILLKELLALPDLKKRLAELESCQNELQEHQHQSLLQEVENQKKINQELQDKIDELTSELENLQHCSSAGDSISTGGVSRTHSWLSDYKKAALSGFKRRGSESSSEENSDNECPTSGKVRRTFLPSDGHHSLELETIEDRCDNAYCESSSSPPSFKPQEDTQPASIDVLLRDMFVDQEHLKNKLYDTDEVQQMTETSDAHVHYTCKVVSKMAYEASKIASWGDHM